MKKLVSVFIVIVFTGCLPNNKSSIHGTWKLISATRSLGDSVIYSTGKAKFSQIKMIYNGHFVFTGRFIVNNDTLDNYGGGTYSLQRINYTENIAYHMNRSYIGNSIPFEAHIAHDTLIMEGPRKIGKYRDVNWRLMEKYVRVR